MLILVHPHYFTESSSQLRGANFAEHREEGEEEGEEEVEGKDGVELVQMSKANQKSHQISTIELSTVKTSAY